MPVAPSPASRRAAATSWSAWVALLGAIVAGVFLANRPIAPAPAGSPPGTFSEARAFPIVRHLSDEIGFRPTGSEGAERTAQYLAARLREIPGLEVDVQRVAESRWFQGTFVPWPVLRYRVTNVVARLPGRTRDAVLLNAHFDTLGDSTGAGDDAVGVAAILETARALAAGPRLERSVIVLCNGGEEYGLFGADAFIRRHPLARDVRAYVYLDGSPGGVATLLYAGPGTPSLIEAWARVAPRPQGTSAYLDLIESGVLAHDGDHRPFRDTGLPGLLLAPIGDVWAAHTSRDRASRLEPGTLQHAGESTLAITRALASGGAPLPAGIDPSRVVYFDVFGLFVVRYRATTTGVALALAAALLAVGSVAALFRRRRLDRRALALAAGGSLLGLLAAVLAAVLAGALLAFVLRRPHGWYAAPWVVVPAFVAPAVAAMLAVQSRLARRLERRGADPVWAVWAAAVVGWSLLSLVAAARGARSGYIPLVWSASLSIGLLAALRWEARRRAVALVAVAPGFFVIAHLGPLLRTMCAQAGLQPLPVPADPVVALLCGALVAAAGAAVAIPAQASGGAGRAALVAVAVAVVGVAVSAIRPPFTAERPRRVLITHGDDAGRSAYLLRARDDLPLDPVLAQIPEARPARAGWTSFEFFEPAPTHEIPAPSPAFSPPRAEVLSSTPGGDGTRTVQLRLVSATPDLRLFVQRGRVVRWSIDPHVPENPLADGRAMVYFSGFPAEGETVSITLRGDAPADVELISTSFLPDDALLRVARRFPAWAVPVPMRARSVKLRI